MYSGMRKSQSHRFSEVYFHAGKQGADGAPPARQSQSHRFSEVYFHFLNVGVLGYDDTVAIPSL